MARTRSRGTKEWSGVALAPLALTTTQALLVAFAHDLQETILRIRGQFLATGVPDTAFDDETVGVGAIVVTDNAVAAGGVSLPGPISDPDASWIWHAYMPLMSLATTSASDVALGCFDRVIVDSKAMRKSNRNESLAFVGQLATGDFGSVRIQGGVRVLSLLG